LHPPDRALSEEAYERLKTIGEYTDLGSGFKIAMRDLEIRGAGNLLGAEQSGQIAAVGFDLYMEMVTEAVGELTGELAAAPAEVSIDLPVDAHLPRDYIARDDVRLEAYRHLAAVTSDADVDDVAGEWADRYGPPPPPAAALLDVARLRVACLQRAIREVSLQRGRARFTGLELRKSQEVRLQRFAPGSAVVDGAVTVPFAGPGKHGSIAAALRFVLAEIDPVDQAPIASTSA
jgi:transcription-repair coupling factor (superfamily II helicase)